MTGGDRERGSAVLKGGDTLLQHRLRGVHDPGVDVAEGLQSEKGGGVVGIVEHKGCGLIDGGCARARRRIGLGAGMDRKGAETKGRFIGHFVLPYSWRIRAYGPASRTTHPKDHCPIRSGGSAIKADHV